MTTATTNTPLPTAPFPPLPKPLTAPEGGRWFAQAYRFSWDVQVFDTDAYGVMWHGAITKWLEQGRVDWLKKAGVALIDPHRPPTPEDNHPCPYIFPVTHQQVVYKAPARLHDTLRLSTWVGITKNRWQFVQQTHRLGAESTETLTIAAITECATLDLTWRPIRAIPETLVTFIDERLAQ